MTRDEFYEQLMRLNERFGSVGPELEVTIRDPDVGLQGYIVVWNTGLSVDGPLGRCAKGGTRITPTLTLEEVKNLAKTMALKNAAADLPLGGAKSGIQANPDDESMEKLYRRFVRECRPLLKENGGLYGGFGYDLGARPQQAIWCCDELGSRKSFTGKPPELGGTDYDREGIAGIGVAEAARKLIELSGERIETMTVAIQGLGNVGSSVLRDMVSFGARVTAISDLRLGGTFVFKDQVPAALLDPLPVENFAEAKRVLLELGHSPLPEQELLSQKVDILMPCAIQDVIRIDNVSKLQARYVVEGANYPCTPGARACLYKRGVQVLPDFMANPGGIIAAYVELMAAYRPELQQGGRTIVETAKAFTREKVTRNIEQMMHYVQSVDVQPADAGKFIALKKLYNERADFPDVTCFRRAAPSDQAAALGIS